jgi:hypothetical protein
MEWEVKKKGTIWIKFFGEICKVHLMIEPMVQVGMCALNTKL